MKKYVLSFGIVSVLSLINLAAAPIELAVGQLNPQAHVRAMGVGTDVSRGAGYYIIQSKEKITPEWRASLKGAGVKIYSYLPENAYLVYCSDEAARAVEVGVEYDQFVVYQPAFKIEPSVSERIVRENFVTVAGDAFVKRGASDETHKYAVLMWDEAVAQQAIESLKQVVGVGAVDGVGCRYEVTMTHDAVEQVAEIEGVQWIEAATEFELFNHVSLGADYMNVTPTQPITGDNVWGLTGAGQIVGVCDSGLDTGNTSTLHEDVRGRILAATTVYGSYPGRTGWSDLNGHGTHVVGSVLGNGTGDEKARGAAYEAQLVMQAAGVDSGTGMSIQDLYSVVFPWAYRKGARIHSNSWGGGEEDVFGNLIYGEYDSWCASADRYLFENPDFLAVFAAGNSGEDGACTLGSPGSAKNVLTVGATEKKTTGQGMAWFSSQGPCKDGRTKPDVSAVGMNIYSLKVGGGYQSKQGTSMATPLTAGTAALVREWLAEQKNILNPDGATIKALMLAGAKTLSAMDASIPATYPDNLEGWGQVDLGHTLGTHTNPSIVYDAQVVVEGETQAYQIEVHESSDISIVMAYYDAPGSYASVQTRAKLVNDLDLTVVGPTGMTYYPNSLAGADRLNTVEGIVITNAPTGTYTIRVNGYSIPTPMNVELTDGQADASRFSVAVVGVIGTQEATLIELDTALDTGLIFEHSSTGNWFGQSVITHDGKDAAQSEEIDHGELSALATKVEGPGRLSFWWKVSSETNDILSVATNGVVVSQISGTDGDWEQMGITIPAGETTIEWKYEKDEANTAGHDAGWLDQVSWTEIQVHDLVWYAIPNSGYEWTQGFFLSNEEYGNSPVTRFKTEDQIYINGALVNANGLTITEQINAVLMLEGESVSQAAYLYLEGLEENYIGTLFDEVWDSLENLFPGKYRITACLNYDESIRESNYENNIATVDFEVLAPVEVPLAWFEAYGVSVSNEDVNAAAMLPSGGASGKGKRDANGDPILLWQDYVMGTDPKTDELFRIVGFTIANGVPQISYEPDLQWTRRYTVEGKAKLDGEWVSPATADSHFFRVKVEMP